MHVSSISLTMQALQRYGFHGAFQAEWGAEWGDKADVDPAKVSHDLRIPSSPWQTESLAFMTNSMGTWTSRLPRFTT